MPKNSKPAPVVNDVVHIVFRDHAENGDTMLFEVFGRLFSVDKTQYQVKSWGYVNDVDRASDGRTDNETWYSIVRSAVESIRILE